MLIYTQLLVGRTYPRVTELVYKNMTKGHIPKIIKKNESSR